VYETAEATGNKRTSVLIEEIILIHVLEMSQVGGPTCSETSLKDHLYSKTRLLKDHV
jgi:hypothetical protein